MRPSRPSTCLLCSFSRPISRRWTARGFSAASRLTQDPRGKGGKRLPKPTKLTSKDLKNYTKEDKSKLEELYSPAQRAAIEVGESVVNRKHLAAAGTRRGNDWSLQYEDDMSKIDPVMDHPIKAPYTNTDPNLRMKTEDELDTDLARFVRDLPEDPESPEANNAFQNFEKNLRLTVGKEEAEFNTRSDEAPELFRPGDANLDGRILRIPEAEGRSRASARDIEPSLLQLMQMTGYTMQQILSLRVKPLICHGVVNITRLGRIRKTYFLSVAGNGNGMLGIGEGKADDMNQARLQSQYRAIKNMQPILRYEGRTIFGDVKAKVSATELEIMSRPPGLS